MAKIEKETNDVVYSGNVMVRLMEYMRPYAKTMVVCITLALIATGIQLYRPILIGSAIDDYIENYDAPFAMVDDGPIVFDGKHLSRDLEGADTFAQLVLYDNQYYFFENLTPQDSDALREFSSGVVEPSDITTSTITIYDFTGKLVGMEELKVLRASDVNGVLWIGLLYVLVLIGEAICNFVRIMMMQKTGQNIIFTVREEIFHHVHALPLRYFDTHPVGRTVTRCTNDVEGLHELYSTILIRLLLNSLKIVGLAVVMLNFNTRLALYSFVMLPLIVFLTWLFRNVSRRIHRSIRTKVSGLNTFLSENISGMRLIQIFANENMKYGEFSQKSRDLYRANLRQITVYAIFRPLIYFISEMAFAMVLYFGARDVIGGSISVGVLYIFASYIASFYEPIQDMSEQLSTLQSSLASAEKIFSVMDVENDILEKENPTLVPEIKGKIEFKNVWFAYEDDNYVLRDVSFVIEPGQRVAFVGATGAGKSSILNLVGRYYDIQKGQILIDDVDIKEMSIHQIRQAIGQVQQDVFIFTGDIKSNIRLLNDEITDETIRKSAKTVNASHFIEQLPKQYDEPVSERGATLSAGQRQLLSFTRTLAFEPKILVMDEATANIDTETESLIQDALERLMEGRTTIMVAHRLSTIQHADNIVVLHKGKIREMGTHQQLLMKDGIYKKLYELQLYSQN